MIVVTAFNLYKIFEKSKRKICWFPYTGLASAVRNGASYSTFLRSVKLTKCSLEHSITLPAVIDLDSNLDSDERVQ